MKKWLTVLVLSCAAAGFVAPVAEARRLGGGMNLGKQRSSPAMREAPREAPRATPAPAPASPASVRPAPTVPPTAAPRPGFLNRWGGVIAGVGAGALLGSLLGGHLGGFGSALGGLLNLLLVAGLLYFVYRLFTSRRQGGAAPSMRFAGAGGPSFGSVGSRSEPAMSSPRSADAPRAEAVVAPGIAVPPGFEIEPFVRQAQTSFLRLQAANDDRDLADLRETTTPEVFAELAMQIRERGDAPQKTEILSLDARLIEVVREGDHLVASLRYSGLVREAAGAAPIGFDEAWHLRRSAREANDPWLVSGIQQLG